MTYSRWVRTLVAVAALVAAVVLPLSVMPAGATTFSNTTPINGQFAAGTPPALPYPSNIGVSGLSGTVTDVNVTLCGFSATFPEDVDMMLAGPTGSLNALIWSDAGGNNTDPPIWPVENLSITLSDQAPQPLIPDGQLTSGTYQPIDDDDDPEEIVPIDGFPPPAPALSGNVALSTFNGINPNGAWSLYIVDDFTASPANGELQMPTFACGWSIDITTTGGGTTSTTSPTTTSTSPTTTTTAPPADDVAPPADFDGDGDTDVSVFRPSSGIWFAQGGATTAWGGSGDIPVPGDYDGDIDIDVAVFRPSNGIWFVNGGPTVAWGASGDIPVPGDYDGDGDTDIAVFRPSNGIWFVNGGPTVAWGASGDIPVPGDYDGDGDTDIAVFRPSNGIWFVQGGPTVAWGASGDIPVPGDYDGDGDTDIAVFRPSNGIWFVQGGPTVAWGASGDIPVPGDYDGDGDTDFAVFRPASGIWFVEAGPTVAWGTSGDVPLPLPDAIRRFFFPPL